MLITPLLSVLAPHDCIRCGDEGMLLCLDCRGTLKRVIGCCYKCGRSERGPVTCRDCRRNSPLAAVYAVTPYEGVAIELLMKLKFGRARSAAREIGAMLAGRLGACSSGAIVVCHVPTAPARVRQRGYDQAALIAEDAARHLGLWHIPLLARQGRQKQMGATKAVRASQMAAAFRPIRGRHIRGATILLVDDVMTTGATLEACAAVLLAAGAKRVEAAVFARA